MSRLRRILIPGLPAHVVHRGNDRQAIFHCDGDRLFLRRCLADAVARFDIQLHAYVFMTNHVHLLMTPPQVDSISRAMQSAARRYVGL